MRRLDRITDEQGVAVPMALMSLLLLTTLMMAFAVLAQTEPVIAANQMRVAQARALAESGLERALWALKNDTDPNGIPDPMVLAPGLETPAAPWDGVFFTQVGVGGYTVAVRNDPPPISDPDVRVITATGWTPTNNLADGRTKAHRRISARVLKIKFLAQNAPCALCSRGALDLSGKTQINGTNVGPGSADCGGNDKYGSYSRDATTISGGATSVGGTGHTWAQNQPDSSFDAFTYSGTQLDAFKDLAKRNGTYYGPGYPNGGFVNNGATTWSGEIQFDNSNQMSNGIVFIDTEDGVNVFEDSPDAAKEALAKVVIQGNPFTGQPKPGSSLPNVPTSDPSQAFTGALIVNGSLQISGNMQIRGLVYAVNDFVYNGTGTGAIHGLVISQNVRDDSTTSVDTASDGNSDIRFDCGYARLINLIPPDFTIIAGSYRELSD